MNKTQFIDVVAEEVDLPKTKINETIDAVFNAITAALKKDEQVVFTGFGTFAVKKRPARTGRNPRTGGVLEIPAAIVAGFKAGKGLKDALNGVVAKKVEKA